MTDPLNVCVNPGCGQELPPIHMLAEGHGQDEHGAETPDAEITECPTCETKLQRTAPSDPWQLRLT